MKIITSKKATKDFHSGLKSLFKCFTLHQPIKLNRRLPKRMKSEFLGGFSLLSMRRHFAIASSTRQNRLLQGPWFSPKAAQNDMSILLTFPILVKPKRRLGNFPRFLARARQKHVCSLTPSLRTQTYFRLSLVSAEKYGLRTRAAKRFLWRQVL